MYGLTAHYIISILHLLTLLISKCVIGILVILYEVSDVQFKFKLIHVYLI